MVKIKKQYVRIFNNLIYKFLEDGVNVSQHTTSSSSNKPGVQLKRKIRKNIFIENNKFENITQDAIRLNVSKVFCEIKNNEINNSSGIFVSNAAQLFAYNNKLVRKKVELASNTFGICAENISSSLKVFNNLIVNPGNTGVFVKPAQYKSKNSDAYLVVNNTIINPTDNGINLKICDHKKEEKDCKHDFNYGFYNNLIVQYKEIPNNRFSFIKMSGYHKDADLKESNNYFASSFEGLKLKDTVDGNYSITANSPLINNGKQVEQFAIMQDIDGLARPQEGMYDIGCYEFKMPVPSNRKVKNELEVMAFPNFENNSLILINIKNLLDQVEVGVYNCFSQKLDEVCLKPNFNEIDMQSYNSGIYYIVIRTKKRSRPFDLLNADGYFRILLLLPLQPFRIINARD